MTLQYSMVIQWSDKDNAYLVTLPEFSSDPQTHGDSYGQAMKHGLEALETLVEFYKNQGRTLPRPQKYRATKVRRKIKQEKVT